MTENRKSFIKATILGLIGGGAASSLYALNKAREDDASDSEFTPDQIYVPLSRTNFMKAVRPERRSGASYSKKQDDRKGSVSKKDLSGMTASDISRMKKELLKKNAGSDDRGKCSSVANFTGCSSSTRPVRNVSGVGSTYLRDRKGRFTSSSDLDKSAGMMDDARGVIADNIGAVGGFAAGLVLMKKVTDRILVNKKKRQVETSRKRYADALASEVNDVDTPYYRKSASSRGLPGEALGVVGLTGLATAGVAGLIMYRIMENRRKDEERMKDKDLSKYPPEKTIKFRFPDVSASN